MSWNKEQHERETANFPWEKDNNYIYNSCPGEKQAFFEVCEWFKTKHYRQGSFRNDLQFCKAYHSSNLTYVLLVWGWSKSALNVTYWKQTHNQY